MGMSKSRAVWAAKMAWGFFCCVYVMCHPTPWPTDRFFMWALSWAGFWAFSPGYAEELKLYDLPWTAPEGTKGLAKDGQSTSNPTVR